MLVSKLRIFYVILEILSKKMVRNLISDNSYSGCRCYTYLEKRHSTSGIFKSPVYSNYFSSNIPCILYIFKGSPGQIVKLIFQSFQLRSQLDGSCVDYLELYLNLEFLESFSENKYDYRLCTNLSNQNEFYSKYNILVMKFYFSPTSQSEYLKGFVGNFQFFSKESFRSAGRRIIGSQCSRQFFSPSTNEWSEEKSGRFFSPNYPQNYEPNMRCQFIFKGQPDERIIITFRSIHLDSQNTHCFPESQYDYIFITEEIYGSQKMALAHLCGTYKYVQIVSHGPSVTVSFISNQNDIERQGFEAMYNFVAKYKVYATSFINTTIDIASVTKVDLEQISQPEEYEFYSKSSPYGTVSSPNFPNGNSNACEIFYIFYGFSNQIIEIKFRKFNLGSIQNCERQGEDRIEIYDGEFSRMIIKSKTPNIIFCGNWNYYYKSTSNFLTMRFVSISKNTEVKSGFSFDYKFISLISSTLESPSHTVAFEKNSKCQYFIHSNGTVRKGRIAQFLERDNQKYEVCKWVLEGTKNQRIVLKIWNSGIQSDGNNGNSFVQGCRFAKELKVLSYRSDSLADDVHSDIGRWCMADGVYSIMSSNIPKMDIIMDLGSLKASSDRYNEAFHVEYSFVEDFGVISNGIQKNSTCYFHFDSSRSRTGNFSSPNYPGYIPSNIACVYVFRGSVRNQIQISLTEKELVRYQSFKCSENNTLQFDSCSSQPSEIPQYICIQNEIRRLSPIIWADNCLRIYLTSTGRGMYNGFMGHYNFINIDQPNFATAWSSFNTANSLIIVMTITFFMIIY